MIRRNMRIKNFIFAVILIGIIIYMSSDVSKAYGDETDIDYSRYYYLQLSNEAKLIYDALYNNIDSTKSGDFKISKEISKEMFEKLKADGNSIVQSAMDAFDRDHPEVFWIDISKIQIKFKSNQIVLEPIISDKNSNYLIDDYSFNEQPLELVNIDYSAMENVLLEIEAQTSTMTQLEQIKYIHDYLVVNNDYNSDPSNAFSKAYKSVSAITGNIDNQYSPLCEGYARAFKVICDRIGIPCVIVSGKAIVNNQHLGHMWNYVMLDNKWYAIDVTWDDPVIISGSYDDLSHEKKYEYFLIGEERENKSHIPVNVFTEKEGYNVGFNYPNIYPLVYNDKTPLYSVTLTKYSNGTITTNLKNNEYVRPNTVVTVNVVVKEGMKLIEGSLKVNGKPINDMSFVMPEEHVVITAAFMTDVIIEDEEEDIKEENKEEQKDETIDDNKNEDDDNKVTQAPIPNPEDSSDSDNNKTQTTKKPVTTKRPNNLDKEPTSTYSPNNKDESGIDNPETRPQNTKTPSSDKTPPNKKPDVIIVEDNFDVINPLANIKIVNKATIAMSNKEVVYNYKPFLNNKDITFYIANVGWSKEKIVDIVSSRYLVDPESEINSLQILVYDNKTNKLVDYISESNPITLFIPVDASWVSPDYDDFFYSIKNEMPEKKIVMVRESRGQYYLQITLENAKADYAIIRKRSAQYVIPGTTDNNITTLDTEIEKEDVLVGIREIILIGLAMIAVLLTIKVVVIQHKYKNVDKDE